MSYSSFSIWSLPFYSCHFLATTPLVTARTIQGPRHKYSGGQGAFCSGGTSGLGFGSPSDSPDFSWKLHSSPFEAHAPLSSPLSPSSSEVQKCLHLQLRSRTTALLMIWYDMFGFGPSANYIILHPGYPWLFMVIPYFWCISGPWCP